MKASKLLRKLNYLPRGAWYILSFFIGGPFGPPIVYFAFKALSNAAEDEKANAQAEFNPFDWGLDIDIDKAGVHVRRSGSRTGSVGRGYQDDEVVVSDDADIETRWAQTEQSASQAKSKVARAPIGENASVDEVIRQGREAMRTIRRANDMIPDPALSRQIDSIENSCAQILSILEQRPQLLPELRTFLRYYLPTTLDLLEARAKLDKGATTPKAREVRSRISDALGVIDKAFQKQVEALDEYRFIDLESEMDVLSDMLKSDGLVDMEAEEDPFADVLAARAESKNARQQGTPMAGH